MRSAKCAYLAPLYLTMFLLLPGLSGCGNLQISNLRLLSPTVISDIKAQHDEATVSLQGKVVNVVPLIQQQVYQVQDSTGKIWVLTHRSNVRVADQVSVAGKAHYQRISIDGKDVGEVYVEEN
jgi:RecJ-like exonuclease